MGCEFMCFFKKEVYKIHFDFMRLFKREIYKIHAMNSIYSSKSGLAV